MKKPSSNVLLSLSLVLAAVGCKESRASTEAAASATQAVTPAPAAAAKSVAVTTKIVFVDKEHGCQCTAKRVDASWSALQGAIAGKATPVVERIHVDTQPEMAEPYSKLRPMMTLPALYFIDGQGGLIELLQGEVTTEQIQKVLGTSGNR
jgi:hypothetical protein